MTDKPKIPPIGSHVLTTLILNTPFHAWWESKYLNPDWQEEQRKTFDIGKVVHKMVLENETEKGFSILDYPSFQSKAAREDRDAAYDAGETPILRKDHVNALAMYDAAKRQLPILEHCSTIGDPSAGEAEVSLEFEHEEVLCRCRLDWRPLKESRDGKFIHDLKSANNTAEPHSWARQNLFWRGMIQAAYYRYIQYMVTCDDRWPVFAVIETKPPYAMSVVQPGEAELSIAEGLVMKGLETYQECCVTGNWPAYRTTAVTPEPAKYQITQAESML